MKSANSTNLRDVLSAFQFDLMSSLNCVKVGRIESFDAQKKTATVQLLVKRILPDGTASLPKPLLDCPVFTLQGNGGGFQAPVSSGDHCLVLFADRNLDAWFETGAANTPYDGRMHDLSDGIALVGINPLTSTLANYEASTVKMFLGSAQIACKGGKIRIKNGTTDLLTVMNAFVDLLATLQVEGPLPLTSASVTSLNAFKTTLAGLLETPS